MRLSGSAPRTGKPYFRHSCHRTAKQPPLAGGFFVPGIRPNPIREESDMAKRPSKGGLATVSESTVHSLFPMGGWDPMSADDHRDQSYLRKVKPQNANQQRLMEAIKTHNVVVALGPAGTGKTYLAISSAVEALEQSKVDRIVLSRPAIEAGESIGYLPGDMHEKMAPFLRPLYDALTDRLGSKRLRTLMADGTIEIAPVGFMRGRTLNNAFVVIDEAQNCTYAQIKMLLTRLGWHSTMVLTGDPDQTDLLNNLSGLADISRRLEAVEGIEVVRLNERDIVRHPLVASMLTVL
jgi:phosphate starvation-inducible PhoH-like protein